MHQVGFIYKIMQGFTVNKTLKNIKMKSIPFPKKDNFFHRKYLKKAVESCEGQYLLFVLRLITITTYGHKISEFVMFSRLLYRVILRLRSLSTERQSSDRPPCEQSFNQSHHHFMVLKNVVSNLMFFRPCIIV